jgi:hypothetical protein
MAAAAGRADRRQRRKVMFEDDAREWVEMQAFDPSTRLTVENRLGVHFYPAIGGKQLRNIKPSTMQGCRVSRAWRPGRGCYACASSR